MWIEDGWRGRSAGVRGAVRRSRALLFALGLGVLAACGDSGGSEAADGAAAGEPVEAPAAAATTQPTSVADLFPEGAGREIVLNNCSSCHAVACAVVGQRPASRWQELASAHREHVPSLSDADRELAFAYLASHFNDAQPEPNVPPEFIQGGCTPF